MLSDARPVPGTAGGAAGRLDAARRDSVLGLLLTVVVVASALSQLPGARFVTAAAGPAALAVVALGPADRVLSRRVPLLGVAFLAWCAASLLWSADRGGSARALVDLAVVVAVAFAAGSLLTLRQLHGAVTVAVKALLVATVVALLVAPGWSTEPAVDGAPGWHGPFSHKNALGAFLVLAAVTLWTGRGRRAPWLVVVGVLLVGAQSSTAVALVVLAGLLVAWQAGFVRVRSVQWRGLYLGVSLLGLGLLAGLLSTRRDLLTDALGRSGTLSGRTEIWDAVLRQVTERPLVGYGWGGVWGSPTGPTREIWREVRFEAFYAHNGYLDLLLQVGVVGLVLFLLLVGRALVALWRARTAPAASWGVLVLLTGALTALSESSPFTGSSALLLLALAVAVVQPDTLTDEPARARPGAARGGRPPGLPAHPPSGTRTPRARSTASSSA